MEMYYGMTDELYRAVTTLIDERLQTITINRQDFFRVADGQRRLETRMDRVEAALGRLAEAQARTEERVNQLAEAQARTEERMNQLAEAQARTEERLTRVEAAIERLAEAQARTEERVNQLAEAQARTEERVNQLAEAQARTEERLTRVEAAIERLTEAQARTEMMLHNLIQTVEKGEDRQRIMQNQHAMMRGDLLEMRYRERAGTYWGKVMRRVRAYIPSDLEDELETRLSSSDYMELLLADLLVRGRPRHDGQVAELWLVLEVSAVVDRHDVERARQRADILRKAQFHVLPAVVGFEITQGANSLATEQGVVVNLNGQITNWEAAFGGLTAE